MARHAKGSPSITIRVPMVVIDRLNEIVDYSGHSVSEIVRAAIDQYLIEYELAMEEDNEKT